MGGNQADISGRKLKKVKHRLSMRIILVLMLAVCAVMLYRTWQVDKEIGTYVAVKEDLNTQIEQEKENQESIRDQISYMNSDAYIEEQAREKLGLVFDNEIIFKKLNH